MTEVESSPCVLRLGPHLVCHCCLSLLLSPSLLFCFKSTAGPVSVPVQHGHLPEGVGGGTCMNKDTLQGSQILGHLRRTLQLFRTFLVLAKPGSHDPHPPGPTTFPWSPRSTFLSPHPHTALQLDMEVGSSRNLTKPHPRSSPDPALSLWNPHALDKPPLQRLPPLPSQSCPKNGRHPAAAISQAASHGRPASLKYSCVKHNERVKKSEKKKRRQRMVFQ